MSTTLVRRADVAEAHTWNTASIFADLAAWDTAYHRLEGDITLIQGFQGRLGSTGATLLAWFQLNEQLGPRLTQLLTYALMAYDVDSSDQQAAGRRDRVLGLLARFNAASAFAQPELLALGTAKVEAFMTEEPRLALYAHYLHNIERMRLYVRSAEVEQVLAMASEPLTTAFMTYQALAEGELRFGEVSDSIGTRYTVSRGTIGDLLGRGDHTLRRNAWLAYTDGYLSVKNTLAATLAGYVRGNVFHAQVRGFPNALEASLITNNIPTAVFHTVIDACNRHLPIWHRYWELRREALKQEKLEGCDIFAPLATPTTVEYDQAVDWICTGMAPLGEDYVRTSRAGLTHERWVDRYPNQGKIGGAYSGGTYGTAPFMFMNYTDDLVSMSTLAHELGHSMHTWYSAHHQPFVYSNYSLFVAEVASNFNQALVRGHLLKQDLSPDLRIGILEEAMNNFHRYLFVMPILAQFELYLHQLIEQGKAITADLMNAHLAELFRRGYGAAVAVDEQRDGVIWAEFSHLFMGFYVYQYASGIAAANALAAQVLSGETEVAQRYLRFLSAGSSVYPLDALRIAGVDLTTPDVMDRAFGVLEEYVSELEHLLRD